jgi:hypothetical protein
MIGKPVVNYAVSALRQAVAGADPDAGTLSLVSGIPNKEITKSSGRDGTQHEKGGAVAAFSTIVVSTSGVRGIAHGRRSDKRGRRKPGQPPGSARIPISGQEIYGHCSAS